MTNEPIADAHTDDERAALKRLPGDKEGLTRPRHDRHHGKIIGLARPIDRNADAITSVARDRIELNLEATPIGQLDKHRRIRRKNARRAREHTHGTKLIERRSLERWLVGETRVDRSFLRLREHDKNIRRDMLARN